MSANRDTIAGRLLDLSLSQKFGLVLFSPILLPCAIVVGLIYLICQGARGIYDVLWGD